ncbi:MAG: hypothetical protein QOI10_2546 [Solirubrobacterales bacterium]|nr:hypothetical protein [Solirubrobacterales bacterium]
MRERLINRRQQGDLGEASAIEWLARLGATVSLPVGHSPDYDLIAELGGRLLRVQVKTSTRREPTLGGDQRWSVAIRTNGGNQSWTGTTKWFDADKVDALFILVGDGRRWCIPAAAVEATHGLRLGGPKYNGYEVEPASTILPLVYGDPGDDSRIIEPDGGGSAGAGEPGQAVNLVAMPEWVRIPPPPSPAPGPCEPGGRRPPKFSRTRISSGHQITIPTVPFGAAGFAVGDRLELTADGPGRVILERIEAPPG